MTEPLPRSVVAFLHAHVDHIVKLRILVLLHGAPSSTISFRMASRSLDVPLGLVRDMATALEEEGLVRLSGELLELAPGSIERRLAIADLARCYLRDREHVLSVLSVLSPHHA